MFGIRKQLSTVTILYVRTKERACKIPLTIGALAHWCTGALMHRQPVLEALLFLYHGVGVLAAAKHLILADGWCVHASPDGPRTLCSRRPVVDGGSGEPAGTGS